LLYDHTKLFTTIYMYNYSYRETEMNTENLHL
jgi:hypothetical protein